MLLVGKVDIVAEDFPAGGYAHDVGVARSGGIGGRAVAVIGNQTMEGPVAITVDIAEVADRLAGGVNAVDGNVFIGPGRSGNVDFCEAEICHALWWRPNPSGFGGTCRSKH